MISSFWQPPNRDQFLEMFITTTNEAISNHSNYKTKVKDNLTKSERTVLKSITSRNDWVIKPADKGSAIVIMDKEHYITEANKILDNKEHYKRLKSDPTNKINTAIKAAINDEYQQGYTTKQTRDFLICSDPRPGKFYMLPKIHKKGIPFRLIISTINHPTQGISEYIDYHLQPLAANLPSYVKDTTHFLQLLQHLEQIPPGSTMVTFDVVSLYPNIPIEEGFAACQRALDQRENKTPPTSTIIRFLKLVLYNNNFVFNSQHYLQIHGTVMGQKMAPSYAIIFMGDLESKLLKEAYSTVSTWLWHRFIDDIYSLFTANLNFIIEFFNYINSFHKTIKFTTEYSQTSFPFLDVRVHADENGKIMTDLYEKPTDTHQYLHFQSAHPRHMKLGVPYSLAIRICRICSEPEWRDTRLNILQQSLIERDYPHNLVKEQINRAKSIPRPALLQYKTNRETVESH
ncbi:uncharacterized protein [Ptychodera flava]|uniref:uncharacterized protein n=1 Tax=Ptychodera flava TaxID=63121 RepID=UPI00396A7246